MIQDFSAHQIFMQRCLQIAGNGLGSVAPNPMVGAVLVHRGQIVAEGYHRAYGLPHAEVEAIGKIKSSGILRECTLYVSLEPCCHYGKTPPCTELIIKSQIPRVVVATADPFPKVNGGGIEQLRNHGIEVLTGVLGNEARALNKRFFTYYTQHRPYVILKWAKTADGFMDKIRTAAEAPAVISNAQAHRLSHWWRGQEQAIMVGTRTALMDNPALTTRLCAGKSPLRAVVDAANKLPRTLRVFDNKADTAILPTRNIAEMLNILYEKQVQSVIVEGGAKLLQSFINSKVWDEARIITASQTMGKGIVAPSISGKTIQRQVLGDNVLEIIGNASML
jgi:diaminohydroxyphosphoribosylaminopyrimidine deaminase/5-amino-6-(5-phosphoribosylamino)uracil reductase